MKRGNDKPLNKVLDNVLNDGIWYVSFCNKTEINRILYPKTGDDYLLKKRADVVADNTRYLRRYIYLRDRSHYKSFESTFSNAHYLAVINKLSEEDRKKCSEITYGDIFYSDFNAYAESTDFGVMIYLNQSLDYFMFYMNLAFLGFDEDVPLFVRFNAIRIALRISQQQEAMDFDMDPRGILSSEIKNAIHYNVFHEKCI